MHHVTIPLVPLSHCLLLLPATAENAALHLQLSSTSEQKEAEVGELQSEVAALRLQLTDQQIRFEEVRARACWLGGHVLCGPSEWHSTASIVYILQLPTLPSSPLFPLLPSSLPLPSPQMCQQGMPPSGELAERLKHMEHSCERLTAEKAACEQELTECRKQVMECAEQLSTKEASILRLVR